MYKNNLPIIKRCGGGMYSIGGNLFFMGGPQAQPNTTATLASALSTVDPTGISGAISAVSGIGTGLVDSVAGMFGKEDSTVATLAKGMLDPLGGGPIGAMMRKQKDDAAKKLAENKASLAKGNAMMSGINAQTGNLYAADGGELPMVTQFNGGFRHSDPSSQNVNNGIPQGIGTNGKPNIVEKGETKVGDFIYSDQIPVIAAKDYLLPKSYEGKTFADASKLASKYVKDRPYDAIALKGQEVVLNRLKQANNEAIQMKEAAEGIMSPQEQQMKCGGHMKKMKNVYAEGGYTFTDY